MDEVGDPFSLGYAGRKKDLSPLAEANTRASNPIAIRFLRFTHCLAK
jgi:hypothetical protein